jgi:hypothetical protein
LDFFFLLSFVRYNKQTVCGRCFGGPGARDRVRNYLIRYLDCLFGRFRVGGRDRYDDISGCARNESLYRFGSLVLCYTER